MRMGVAKAESEDESFPLGLRIHTHEQSRELSVKTILDHNIVLGFLQIGKSVINKEVPGFGSTEAKLVGAMRDRVNAVDLIGHG